jgi:hypothetical protein
MLYKRASAAVGGLRPNEEISELVSPSRTQYSIKKSFQVDAALTCRMQQEQESPTKIKIPKEAPTTNF